MELDLDIDMDTSLYTTSNKENGLRKRVSENSSSSSDRPCLMDITHKFVKNGEKNLERRATGGGLLRLATGGKVGGGAFRMALPR